MGNIVWKNSYCVGVDRIDREHQKMIEMINDVYALTKSGENEAAVKDVLEGMRRYIETHFATEEALMRKHEYHASTQHIAEHNYFNLKTEAFDKAYKEKGVVNPLEVHRFLSGWMIGHILSCDKELGMFLVGIGAE